MSARLCIRDRTDPTDRTDRTDPLSRTARPRAGYTLIELVSVAALGTILISLAVAGYHTWTRDNSVDAAQSQVRAALARARAYALAHDVDTRFIGIDSNQVFRCYTALEYRHSSTSKWTAFTATNLLPRHISLDMEAIIPSGLIPPNETHVYFNPDGSLFWDDTRFEDPDKQFTHFLRITLYHRKTVLSVEQRYQRHLDVSRMTGLVREVPPPPQ